MNKIRVNFDNKRHIENFEGWLFNTDLKSYIYYDNSKISPRFKTYIVYDEKCLDIIIDVHQGRILE